MPTAPTHAAPTREELAALLNEARERTLALLAPVAENDLLRQHDPLMGPILWDLGHIASFEELWLLHNVERAAGERSSFGEMPGLFDPFAHPRRVRGELILPDLAATLTRLAQVREAALERLAKVDLEASDPLLAGGYVYAMVAQHEHQHGETILQTLQLKQGEPYAAPRRAELPPGRRVAAPGAMVRCSGGEVEVGTDDRCAAYDNERPRHRVALAPFEIDVTAVTEGDYLAFVEDGGYRRRELWSPAGWAWLIGTDGGVAAPKHWHHDGGRWTVRRFDRVRELDPLRPVCHVCWHEAEAYARWAGKRLPSEQEWEVAATWDAEDGTPRPYPWGVEPPSRELANLDQLGFDTAPTGAYPRNVSPLGCHGMIGDVWEWTASDFLPWPGFEVFPYPEYSAVFFGAEHKVLRGGSWATRPLVARATFRNWDYPIRRQIFAGFRCARDA